MKDRGGFAFSLAHLSDEALLGELARVNRAHTTVTAELVAHIAEFDARKLYLVRARPSMFAYCVERLGCSEDEACRRISAARIARKWPVILRRIAAGELSLTVLSKLKPFLNDENVVELVDAVARKSVREAERILATRFPKPDTADSVRKLPETKSSNGVMIPVDAVRLETGAEQVRRSFPDTRAAERPVDRGRTEPLSAERIQVKFTASRALEEKLALARDLMSHSNPRGDLATIIEAALDLLIAERRKKKLGQTKRVQKKARPAKSSRITSATRREVVERDGLGCSFVDADGRRCCARAFLEFDHRDPKGKGGTGERERVRLLCRGHNQLEAERAYGKAFMQRKRCARKTPVLTVREMSVTERFVVGLGDPRWRGYSSSAGRSNRVSLQLC
jgi:hypothetical protein